MTRSAFQSFLDIDETRRTTCIDLEGFFGFSTIQPYPPNEIRNVPITIAKKVLNDITNDYMIWKRSFQKIKLKLYTSPAFKIILKSSFNSLKRFSRSFPFVIQ